MSDGKIHVEHAYAQGKMLDHSGWKGVLPRGITPSDPDMMLDNAGRIIYVELKRWTGESNWMAIPRGQKMLYANAVKHGGHVAALCFHSTPETQQIDTTKCESFSLLAWDSGNVITTPSFDGEWWVNFVKCWFLDADATLKKTIGYAYGLLDK